MTASIGSRITSAFRQTYEVCNKDFLQWFPGHMGKSLKKMQQNLKNIDLIIEVHDARVPLSGRCRELQDTLSGIKPHILTLNKKDLTDSSCIESAVDRLNRKGVKNVVLTNFKDQTCKGMHSLLPLAKKLIKDSNRFNRENEREFSIMVIGVPNVGKSSLINRLRNKHLRKANAAKVGAVAGITRAVMTRVKIAEDVYLIDTPGILSPEVRDIHSGMKLALVGCLLDHLVGPEKMIDYLLFWMNKQQKFDYVDKFGLTEPSDNAIEVLGKIAIDAGVTLNVRNFDGQLIMKPNYSHAAEHFIRLFRSGELGHYCLDEEILHGYYN